MALSIIGTPQVAHANTVTLPTHAIGDIIVIFAAKAGSGAPTKPSAGGTVPAWADIESGSDSTASGTVNYFVATATNHTSGTWTGATDMGAIVLRGQHSSPIGGEDVGFGTNGGYSIAPAVTLQVTDGSSVILEFHFHANLTVWVSSPTGYTRQAAQCSTSGSAINTKDSSTTDGQVSQIITGSSAAYFGATVEILVSGGGGGGGDTAKFFAMF